MDDRLYKILVRVAVLLTLAWVGWSIYDMVISESTPLDHELTAAAKKLEDGHYEQALAEYEQILEAAPENLGALRGMAQALKQLGTRSQMLAVQLERESKPDEAANAAYAAEGFFQRSLEAYDRAIAEEERAEAHELQQSVLGVSYANRGILKDWMGDSRGALQDYDKALELEPEVAEGPGFLTRFLRNQPERPPSVSDRANYLRLELKKPESERRLHIPEIDAGQRAYKM